MKKMGKDWKPGASSGNKSFFAKIGTGFFSDMECTGRPEEKIKAMQTCVWKQGTEQSQKKTFPIGERGG